MLDGVSPLSIVLVGPPLCSRAFAIALTTDGVARKRGSKPLLPPSSAAFAVSCPQSLRNQATGQAMRVTVVHDTTTMMEPDRRGRPGGTLRKVIADLHALQPEAGSLWVTGSLST